MSIIVLGHFLLTAVVITVAALLSVIAATRMRSSSNPA